MSNTMELIRVEKIIFMKAVLLCNVKILSARCQFKNNIYF